MEMIGSQCRLEQTVTEEHTAATIGSGMPAGIRHPVFAAMVESAAMTCLQSFWRRAMAVWAPTWISPTTRPLPSA